MTTIDWKFLGIREGRRLKAYVPDAENSRSGVTIATGVDLGSVDPASLPSSLKARLSPYCGIRGLVAVQKLQESPLEISSDEADQLDQWACGRILSTLETDWNRDSKTLWKDLPDPLATVVFSVTWQYGTPWVRCPKFWKACTSLDIKAVLHELRNFGDAYSTRHEEEATYLESHSLGA